MSVRTARLARASILALLPYVVACGASGSEFSGGTFEPNADAGHKSPTDSGSIVLPDGHSPPNPDAACATDHAGATLGESYLVFVMDRSDSMSANSKWTSSGAALDAFFSDPKAAGIQASLTWLPEVTAGSKSTSGSPSFLCTAADYANPDVPLTPLPSSAFGAAIASQSLEFGTPTLAALEGAATQAQAIATAHPGGKVVVVLATDGLPYGCAGNTVTTVSAAATKLAASGILTYVIGVGTAIGNLDAIAAAGGTSKAFVVPTGNATATEQAFRAALQTVAGSILSCDFSIPSPPSGQTINFGDVNVVYTPGTGVATTLPYTAGCEDPTGWQYDIPTAPTKIELCTQACTTAQGDKLASIDIVFGCATAGGPIQ